MPNPTQPGLSDPHHYPPTTADWVTSPLAQQDELMHNPLEAPTPTGKPILRIGAVLVIVGGLLGIAGTLMQFVQMDHQVIWYLWLVMLTSVLAIGAVGGSLLLLYRVTSKGTKQVILFAFATIAAQLVAIVVALAVTHARAGLGGGLRVSVGSIILLLIGGSILRFVGRPEVSEQELAEQTERDRRVSDYTRGDKFIGGWRRHWNPPRTGD
jgi:hypothetical protein